MKVLFIGGTGIISSACSERAVEQSIELWVLNRGRTDRPAPQNARVIQADIRDPSSVRKGLGKQVFDAVVDWVAYSPDHVESDIELFRGRCGQYVFISSASAYQTPPANLPVTESTPLDNPFWEYSRNKISCEDRLVRAYREERFPVTIVRPSHTYDERTLPIHGRWTEVDRMRNGKKIIIHGDGTSLWVLTHHRDFARGFVGLLGNPHALGEAFHITSDEVLTWNQIYSILAHAAGAEPDAVHIPSDFIAAFDSEWGDNLLGDKSHSMVFDNTKIKRAVPGFEAAIPFAEGAKEIIEWFKENASRRIVDNQFNRLIDRIISAYLSAWPKPVK